MDGTQRSDRIVAITIAILLAAGCIVVLYPFVSALLWAVILCFVTWPTFLWGVRLLGGHRTLAATLMALLVAVLLVAPFVAVGLSLAAKAAPSRYRKNNNNTLRIKYKTPAPNATP